MLYQVRKTWGPRLSAIRGRKITVQQQGILFTLPAVVATLFLIGFPMLFTAWLSLHRWHGSRVNPWRWMGLRNYADVLLRDSYFRHSLWITAIFSGGSPLLFRIFPPVGPWLLVRRSNWSSV